MAQPFLDAGKHRPLVAGLDVDDAVGSQPGLRQGGREEVEAAQAPEHLALGAGGHPGHEESGRRAVHCAVPAPRHLVQRAEREASVGKPFV